MKVIEVNDPKFTFEGADYEVVERWFRDAQEWGQYVIENKQFGKTHCFIHSTTTGRVDGRHVLLVKHKFIRI